MPSSLGSTRSESAFGNPSKSMCMPSPFLTEKLAIVEEGQKAPNGSSLNTVGVPSRESTSSNGCSWVCSNPSVPTEPDLTFLSWLGLRALPLAEEVRLCLAKDAKGLGGVDIAPWFELATESPEPENGFSFRK